MKIQFSTGPPLEMKNHHKIYHESQRYAINTSHYMYICDRVSLMYSAYSRFSDKARPQTYDVFQYSTLCFMYINEES